MAFGGCLGGSAFDKSFHHQKTIMTTPSTSCPPPYPCRPSEFKTLHSSSSTTTTTATPTTSCPQPSLIQQDHLNNNLNKQVLDPSSMNSPDFERLSGTVAMLEASGWYYGQLSWQCAAKKLRQAPVGTFLVRDSADSRYLFSLSVQTERGPTSVRIHYDNGQFQLDAERRLAETMPLFDCVVALVEHYVRLSGTPKAAAHVWLDPGGRRDLAINLSGPLYHGVPTLQHLCRRTINSSVVPSKGLQGLDVLPKPLVDFVRQYPYGR